MRSGIIFGLQRTNSFEEVARVLQTVGKHKTQILPPKDPTESEKHAILTDIIATE